MALLNDVADVRLLPDATSSITPRMVIFHTMAGSLRGTEAHFKNSSKFESHFGVGGSSDGTLDGVIFQWVDTEKKADANRKANDFAISIETSDGGNAAQPWSPKQIESLVKLTRRLCEIHSIPLRVVTSWNDPQGGLGWHVMFGAPGPWTPVVKSCPGPVRIAQLNNQVFPALGINGQATPAPVVVHGTAPAWPGVLFSRGSKGRHVCRIQARLREVGHRIDSVAGCPFGPQTQAAVGVFQRANGLDDDGVVGEMTWKALFGG